MIDLFASKKTKPDEFGEPCPKCGTPLRHSRLLNPDIFGDDDKTNPFVGWKCINNECHGWWCDYCEEWHPYGWRCTAAMVRNMRDGTEDGCSGWAEEDPYWQHREERGEED